MKKCPQCGTILEATKKKCYMCGAELQKSAIMDFGDAFDEQVGATVTTGQNNALTSVTNVMDGANGSVSGNNDNVTFSNAMSTAQEVEEKITLDMPPKYDNRTAIEKIFSTDERYKNIDEFELEKNLSNNDDFNPFSKHDEHQSIGAAPVTPPPPPPPAPLFELKKDEKKKEDINWGNNLQTSVTENNVGAEAKALPKMSFNKVMNIISVAFFVVVVIVLIVVLINKNQKNQTVSFGGLEYQISKDFVLKTEENSSRYYMYGSECALKISYGATIETDTYIDNYFDRVKNSFPDSTTKRSEIQINGNRWTDVSVFDFEKNPAATNGYSEVLRYQYVAIIHRGNFYDIVFANDINDGRCKSMFDQFMNSVKLD